MRQQRESYTVASECRRPSIHYILIVKVVYRYKLTRPLFIRKPVSILGDGSDPKTGTVIYIPHPLLEAPK